MVVNQICGRIKVLILAILGAFRRALCCFSRRRRPSDSECEMLQSVDVICNAGKSSNGPEKDWNSWDDTPRTIHDHIELYRQKLVRPPSPVEAEPEPDYFQDMTPEIKPQAKLLINAKADQTQTDFSRLKATTDIPIALTADLQDWSEEDPGGWEDFDTEAAKKLIREKRKEMRAQKQSRHVHFAEKAGSRNS